MYNDDLWGNFEDLQLTDGAIALLKNQCHILKERTGGKVFGKFTKIKKIASPMVQGMAKVVTQFAKHTASLIPEEQMDEEYENNLYDADGLYSISTYGFEIYNKSYKFRIFEATIPPVYPIKLIVDEDIMEELAIAPIAEELREEYQNAIMINNENELVSSLRNILTSKKVRFILKRMQQE